jgi:hypothetical protein
MTSHNTVAISHQLRFLTERVELMKVYTDGISKQGILGRDAKLLQIYEPIEVFAKAIRDCAEKLEEMGPVESAAAWESKLAFFVSMLNRARSAHEHLVKLSRLITIKSWVRTVALVDDLTAAEEEKEVFFRTIDELSLASMNDLLNLQVPAITSCQACVYAATLVEITAVLKATRPSVVAA